MTHWISIAGRASVFWGTVDRGLPPAATVGRPPSADSPNDGNGRTGWTKVSRIQHTPIADATSLQASIGRPPSVDIPDVVAGWICAPWVVGFPIKWCRRGSCSKQDRAMPDPGIRAKTVCRCQAIAGQCHWWDHHVQFMTIQHAC